MLFAEVAPAAVFESMPEALGSEFISPFRCVTGRDLTT